MATNQKDMRSKFQGEYVINLVAVVHDFIAETSRLYDAYNNEPAIDSIAAQERTNFPSRGQLKMCIMVGFCQWKRQQIT